MALAAASARLAMARACSQDPGSLARHLLQERLLEIGQVEQLVARDVRRAAARRRSRSKSAMTPAASPPPKLARSIELPELATRSAITSKLPSNTMVMAA